MGDRCGSSVVPQAIAILISRVRESFALAYDLNPAVLIAAAIQLCLRSVGSDVGRRSVLVGGVALDNNMLSGAEMGGNWAMLTLAPLGAPLPRRAAFPLDFCCMYQYILVHHH